MVGSPSCALFCSRTTFSTRHSNERDTCQRPCMLCVVPAYTMRMCGHSTLLPCFHGCASCVLHVVRAPRTSVQFGAQCCSTVCLITCQCSRVLASTNHSFCSPGTPLRVADHSVEMRSRGAGFQTSLSPRTSARAQLLDVLEGLPLPRPLPRTNPFAWTPMAASRTRSAFVPCQTVAWCTRSYSNVTVQHSLSL